MKRTVISVFDDLSAAAAARLSQYSIKEPLDDMAKERIYENVMSEIQAAEGDRQEQALVQRPKSVRKPGKVAMIAAACLVAALVGGVSVGATRLYRSYTDYRPAYTEQQKETINQASFPINATVETEGVTFTVTEGMRDEKLLYLMVNVACDPNVVGSTEGKVLDIDMGVDPDGPIGAENAAYSETLAHEGDTYTVIVGFDYLYLRDLQEGQLLHVAINGMSLYKEAVDPETGRKGYCEDQWAFSRHNDPLSTTFTLQGQPGNFGKQFYTEQKIPFQQQQTDMDLGYLSPWFGSFSLYSQGDRWEDYAPTVGTPDIKITMRDGTVYTTDDGIRIANGFSGGGGTDEGGYVCRWDFRMTFDRYLDTVNIQRFEINGVAVDVTKIDLNKRLTTLDYYYPPVED